jgi:CheY-like chemotaxis protein
VKFTPQYGKINVKTFIEDSSFIIEVNDNGQGIEPEFIPYIFDRFRQEDNSLTKKYGGLGLGLSIVRQLVELHGGTIEVSSPGKAQGATFRVTLPLIDIVTHEVKGANIRSDKQTVYLLKDKKILVVDDQEDARELIFRILEKAGATPIMAGSAKEALLLYEKEKPDLIVSDIGMPVENGFSFLRKLRAIETQKGGFTPAMALTAYAQEKDRQQTLAAGFQAYMAKPVSSSAILQILGDLIEKYLNNVHRT